MGQSIDYFPPTLNCLIDHSSLYRMRDPCYIVPSYMCKSQTTTARELVLQRMRQQRVRASGRYPGWFRCWPKSDFECIGWVGEVQEEEALESLWVYHDVALSIDHALGLRADFVLVMYT